MNASNINSNFSLLKEYSNKAKRGESLSAKDNVRILKAYFRMYDRLFDNAVEFNQSEISKPPFSISYHQLNKILFIYFLNKYDIKSNLETSQSSQSIINNFNSLKYNEAGNYFTWLKKNFFPETVIEVAEYLKNNAGKMKEFSDKLKKYNIETLNTIKSSTTKIPKIHFPNLINLVLIYGKYLKEGGKSLGNEDINNKALGFFNGFVRAENTINNLLAKYNSSLLPPIDRAGKDVYTSWERHLYSNYYFRYCIFLSQFYDVGYNDINGFFQREQYFTYRSIKDRLLLTGFDPVNLTDNEYIISDTVLDNKTKSLKIYNITSRVDVTVDQTLKKINQKQFSSLVKAHDPAGGVRVMSYDNKYKSFAIRPPVAVSLGVGANTTGRLAHFSKNKGVGIGNGNGKGKGKGNFDPLSLLKPPSKRSLGGGNDVILSQGMTDGGIKSIKIKIRDQVIGGKSRTIMEVHLNNVFLYVFFKQDKFFHLLRRCDQKIIGSISGDVNSFDYFKNINENGGISGSNDKNQEAFYAKTYMIFPFEFVIFDYCCQAFSSKYSEKLDTIGAKFFQQVRKVFKPKPEEVQGLGNVEEGETTSANIAASNSRLNRKCLFVYSRFPYLQKEYIDLITNL